MATTSGLAPRARVRVTLRPTRRSLAIGAGIVAAAVGAYFLARETSMFAVGRFEVVGGTPAERAAVMRALAPVRGTSLLALAAGFPAQVDTASLVHGELTFLLRSGIELRLGEPVDLRLKLAIARRALPLLAPDTNYLDVAVPGRPVSGTQSQLSSRG